MNGVHIVGKTLNPQLMISLVSNEMSVDDAIYLSVDTLRQGCLAKEATSENRMLLNFTLTFLLVAQVSRVYFNSSKSRNQRNTKSSSVGLSILVQSGNTDLKPKCKWRKYLIKKYRGHMKYLFSNISIPIVLHSKEKVPMRQLLPKTYNFVEQTPERLLLRSLRYIFMSNIIYFPYPHNLQILPSSFAHLQVYGIALYLEGLLTPSSLRSTVIYPAYPLFVNEFCYQIENLAQIKYLNGQKQG